MILTELTYETMQLMNPSFWLLYGLSDLDLMLMNSSVVFYGLLIDVIILLNRYLGCIGLMNLHWINLVCWLL